MDPRSSHPDPRPLPAGAGTDVGAVAPPPVAVGEPWAQAPGVALFAPETDAFVCADAGSVFVRVNTAAAQLFGTTVAAMIGAPVERFVVAGWGPGPMSAAGGPRGIRQTLARRELTGRGADGRRFALEAVVSDLDGGGGAIRSAILRLAGDAATEAEVPCRSDQVLADMFAHSPIGLMCISPDGRVERVNEAQLALLDLPREAVLGQSVGALHTNPEDVARLLARAASGETVHDCHVYAETRSGLRHLLVDANGVWSGVRLGCSRWFVRDITSRTRLEAEILTIAEAERQRIGHDLHDDLCQRLVAIEFMIETLAVRLKGSPGDLPDQAHCIAFHLRAAIERIREVARGLAPALPDQPESLMTLLRTLAEDTTRLLQRDCRFDCPVPVRSPDSATTMHLFRIAQEGVANAIKHGRATRITIRLFTSGPDLVLDISDDGNGAEPHPEKRRGMGLRLMQYRAGAIGGTLAFQRVPGQGTSVVCAVRGAAGRIEEGT